MPPGWTVSTTWSPIFDINFSLEDNIHVLAVLTRLEDGISGDIYTRIFFATEKVDCVHLRPRNVVIGLDE